MSEQKKGTDFHLIIIKFRFVRPFFFHSESGDPVLSAGLQLSHTLHDNNHAPFYHHLVFDFVVFE